MAESFIAILDLISIALFSYPYQLIISDGVYHLDNGEPFIVLLFGSIIYLGAPLFAIYCSWRALKWIFRRFTI